MRKFIFSLIVAIVSISTSISTLSAQPQQRQQQPQRGANFAEFQVQVLTKQLQLDDSKVEAFKKLYTEYTDKIEALQPKPQHRPSGDDEKRGDGQTDEEVEKQIMESFVMAEKSTDLKREYYYKFKEIMSPKQIFKMYNVERRLRERIVSESDRRAEGEGKR